MNKDQEFREAILVGLQAEKERIQERIDLLRNELQTVDQQIRENKAKMPAGYRIPKLVPRVFNADQFGRRREMSAGTRAKISKAQSHRWEKTRQRAAAGIQTNAPGILEPFARLKEKP